MGEVTFEDLPFSKVHLAAGQEKQGNMLPSGER